MDGQQRDFEAWAEKNGFADFDFRGGGYSSPATSGAWKAWQHWTHPQTHCNQGDCHYYMQKRPASCVCSRAERVILSRVLDNAARVMLSSAVNSL